MSDALSQPIDLTPFNINVGGGGTTISFPGQPNTSISFPVPNQGFQLGGSCDGLGITIPPGNNVALTINNRFVVAVNGVQHQLPVTMDPLPYVVSFPSGGKITLTKKHIAGVKYEGVSITGSNVRLNSKSLKAPKVNVQ